MKTQRIAVVLVMTAISGFVWCLFPPERLPSLSLDPAHRDGGSANDHEPFDLREPSGEVNAASGVCVYVVLSPDCPISKSYIPELNRLSLQVAEHPIRFQGIIPGSLADADEVEQHLRQFAISFPVLYDENNMMCRRLGVTHTPQAVVEQHGTQVYSGRIDNLYADLGQKRAFATETDLRDVLNQLATGRRVEPLSTRPVGCLIPGHSRNDSAASPYAAELLTFNRDVAPVLFRHCSRCHHPGTAAPFSLLSIDDARQHADPILDVVERRLMPPWKAEPGYASFRNEHRLTDDEISVLRAWVNSSQPEGDPQHLPPTPQYETGWYLGPPDLELVMPEPFDIPADGPDIYRHFIIPTGLTEHRLVNAVEFRPGAAEVVHHSLMYFDTSGRGREMDAEDPGPGYSRIGSPGFPVTGSLGGWGPGGTPRRLPKYMGRRLLKDSDLVVQIHYHPTGRRMTDQSRIGLYFAPRGSRFEVTEIMVANVDLKIPAGASRHHHRAEYVLPVDTTLLDATPHMHLLGREIKAAAVLPDGSTEPLVWIRDWDFDWQDNYVFEQPVRLPKGTRITLDCWYDNSDQNPLNPHHPPRDVLWGDFSDDEMGICYFQATAETWDDFETLHGHASDYFAQLWEQYQSRTE